MIAEPDAPESDTMAALPTWHTACRADVAVAPDTIAGILDGDGSLYLAARHRKRHVPAVSLSLRDDDVDALVQILRAHPLPATSPKAAQFDAWAELVALRRGILTLGTRGDLARSSTLAAIATEIRAAKRYARHQELCTCRAPGAAADAGSGT